MKDNEERLWQLTVSIAAAMAGNHAGLVVEDAKTAVFFAGHVFTEYMEATRQKPVKIKQDEIEKLRRAFQ